MYFLFFALYKHVTTSAKERIEYPRNFLNSGFDYKILPSEIFRAIGSEALLICETKLNNSPLGKS